MFRVQEACDGAQAVTVASREPFDVVLMDIRMPILDGVSACRHIRQAAPATKVVLITGQPKSEGATPTEATAVLCLYKPILLQDLENVVSRVCGGS